MGLLYIEYQALEILSFGMVDIDRMIGRLGKLMEYSHLAAALGGSAENGQSELLFIDCLRA